MCLNEFWPSLFDVDKKICLTIMYYFVTLSLFCEMIKIFIICRASRQAILQWHIKENIGGGESKMITLDSLWNKCFTNVNTVSFTSFKSALWLQNCCIFSHLKTQEVSQSPQPDLQQQNDTSWHPRATLSQHKSSGETNYISNGSQMEQSHCRGNRESLKCTIWSASIPSRCY